MNFFLFFFFLDREEQDITIFVWGLVMAAHAKHMLAMEK